ncbi:hypothetical protein CMALT394_60005 [Carnobacterium maltaromaticum]|nr:hypothetical protein CMALT394_60005 [Carnobacterium maltaromaticum]
MLDICIYYISVVKLQEVMDVGGNTMDHEKERVLEIKLTYR